MYFNDFNFEIKQKVTDKFKYILTYIYLVNNIEVVQGKTGKGTVFCHIGIADSGFDFHFHCSGIIDQFHYKKFCLCFIAENRFFGYV